MSQDDPDLAQAVLSPDTAMITAIFQTRNAEANRRRQAEQQQMVRKLLTTLSFSRILP